MAGHEWDWFRREELIGQISDIRVQNLQVERENVQKRTFTRWINLHLEKCDPPLEVHDLFLDIQDGKILMALLEVMSGQRLLHEYKSSSHRIFRLNNIAKSLKFVEDSNVKLVSIDAAEIADGNPSMVLGLIWNIILFFQIKELTGNLNRMSSSSSLSSVPSGTDSDTSHPSTPNTEKSLPVSIKDQRKAIKALLQWVQQRTRKYGVAVQDFAGSWRSGLAFLAVIKAIDSSLVDMREALDKSPRENLEDAFRIAFFSLNIPRLLEPEDIMVDSPDEHSIMTYVAQFLEHFPELESEDLSDTGSPVESTYVHYKDGPVEQEGRIVLFNQNEEFAYTVNHESLQPPPPKIFVCSVSDNTEECPLENSNENLNEQFNPSLNDETQSLPREEELQTSESFRIDSLKNAQTLHKVSSTSKEVITNNVSTLDKNSLNYNDTQDQGLKDSLVVLPTDENVDTVDSLMQYSKLPPIDEGIEPQSSTRDLIDITSASFSSLNTPPGASQEYSYKQADKPFFTNNNDLRNETASTSSSFPVENESPITPIDEDVECKYVLHFQDEVPKNTSTAEGYEHLKQEIRVNTCLMKDDRHKGNLDMFRSSGPESSVPSGRPMPELLDIHSGDAAVPKTSPGSAKVSVIPHDLFYYPHYSVPISDVLNAFVESNVEESENKNVHKRQLNFASEFDSDPLALINADFSQPLPKAITHIMPRELDEAPFVATVPETRLNVARQEISPEISNSCSKDANLRGTNISQRGHIDEDPRHRPGGLLSKVKVSAVKEERCKLNDHASKEKENPLWNGETILLAYRESNENQYEDASESIMEEEVHGKVNKPMNNTARAKEGDCQDGENGLSPTPDEMEEAMFEDSWSSRTTQSDNSIYYRRHGANAKDMVHRVEHENLDSNEGANSQMRVVLWNQNAVTASRGSEELLTWQRSTDLVYLIIFVWILVYSLMVLPELDLNKVTFFSRGQ